MKPASLYPATDTSELTKLDIFTMKYGHICLLLSVILLIIMVIILLIAVFHMFGIDIFASDFSTTESGEFYYHLKDVI